MKTQLRIPSGHLTILQPDPVVKWYYRDLISMHLSRAIECAVDCAVDCALKGFTVKYSAQNELQ